MDSLQLLSLLNSPKSRRRGFAVEDKFDIIAPEKVSFSYELAGLGSRFLALLVDFFIEAAFLILLLIVNIFLGFLLGDIAPRVFLWTTGIFIIIGFLTAWAYFILFEALMAGQTPGKRVAGIRVVDESGRPPGLMASAVRNILRIADWLPAMNTGGMISILVSKRNQRLGDIAAGTLVIKDLARKLEIDLPPASDIEIPADVRLAAHRLSLSDYEQIRQFLVRRSGFDSEMSARLSAKLANALAEKMGLNGMYGSAETLLEMLDGAYRRVDADGPAKAVKAK